MKISFTGLESSLELAEKGLYVFRIESTALFRRLSESIISLEGMQAIEPYRIWEREGEEVFPSKILLPVSDVFNLPWKHKDLFGKLYSLLDNELLANEKLNEELIKYDRKMRSLFSRMGLQMNAEYKFGVEWNLRNYLKAFSYEVDLSDTYSFFDKLIKFFDLCADMYVNKVLVFVNLSTFLTENELVEVQKIALFHKLQLLLIESKNSVVTKVCSNIFTIDQDFVEYTSFKKLERPSPSQKGVYSNGFGAVTF